MLRRVLSVLRSQPALGRSVLAGTAALGLALACLNPQNDDLPSAGLAGSEEPRPSATSNGESAVDGPSGNTPNTPAPQEPDSLEPLAPPAAQPEPSPGGEGINAEPDAGASSDAGAPNVAP